MKKNYLLFITAKLFSTIGVVVSLSGFVKEYRDVQELNSFGDTTYGIATNRPELGSTLEKSEKSITYSVDKDGESIQYHVKTRFLRQFSVGDKFPVMYSKVNPEISRVLVYSEYKFPLILDGFLTIFCFVLICLSFVGKEWLLSRGGDFWPYG